MATHSSILAWRIPWTGEPGGVQCMGLQRVPTFKGKMNRVLTMRQKINRFLFSCYTRSLLQRFLHYILQKNLNELQHLNPASWHWECRVITPGPLGKSHNCYFETPLICTLHEPNCKSKHIFHHCLKAKPCKRDCQWREKKQVIQFPKRVLENELPCLALRIDHLATIINILLFI